MDSYDSLAQFVGHMRAAGCGTIIIHARKAYLQGLSPRENRTVPPLKYDYAYRIKQQFPDMQVVLNGAELLPRANLLLAELIDLRFLRR